MTDEGEIALTVHGLHKRHGREEPWNIDVAGRWVKMEHGGKENSVEKIFHPESCQLLQYVICEMTGGRTTMSICRVRRSPHINKNCIDFSPSLAACVYSSGSISSSRN